MHGDFSRWTFDPVDGYRAVLLQQGRVLLDADWNEQTQITARHDEVRSRDVVGRFGGPLDGGGFALVDPEGAPASGTAWADLRITPGRYYVDGVLAEAAEVSSAPGHPLADQPFLPAVGELPGLPEPTADGRYAVLLDVWNYHVTSDESPDLLESALGGPDTTTRSRTVWQVRLVPAEADAGCGVATDAQWADRVPPTMTAALSDLDLAADPCRISTAGGYRRLENQLYRVQIHDVAGDGSARYLWSRENGSVVAQVLAIGGPPPSTPGMDATLTLDRTGRDEELSILEGDTVEVTSTGRQLHGLSGYLATAGAPDGTSLPVAWDAAAPSSLAALGGTPVARRWESPPRAAGTAFGPLEDGIRVRFGAGDFRVGDHWLIPARTVRLVYGVSALSGTIEWPADEAGNPLPQPPLGPVHHVAPIALVDRVTSESAGASVWVLAADCRKLAPPLTELVTIDLIGGDGQESMPGLPLPEPVRVVVRNGGVPVTGAQVRFDAPGGHLAVGAEPTSDSLSSIVAVTDVHGQADVRWLLGSGGLDTQAMTARRLIETSELVDAEIRVTGRRATPGGGEHCQVIRPDEDLAAVFDEFSGVNSLVLCFTEGEWPLSRPAVLQDVGSVIVTGAGPATQITSMVDTALVFNGCRQVTVRDLAVSTGEAISGTDLCPAALRVNGSGRTHIERVHADVPSAARTSRFGIVVLGRSDEPTAERATVRDCHVQAGYRQAGIGVGGVRRVDITGCEVAVWDTDGGPDGDRFMEWLRERDFASRIATRAVHRIQPQPNRPRGSRTGFSHPIQTSLITFGSEINDPNRWIPYISSAAGVDTVDELRERVVADLVNHDVRSPFFLTGNSFSAWLQSVAARFLEADAAEQGIVVGGGVEDVRVCDNSITGILQSIMITPDKRENRPVARVQVRGNTVTPQPHSATGFVQQGVQIGTCASMLVAGNTVSVIQPSYAIEGVQCFGDLGPHASASANCFDGTALGIYVREVRRPPLSLHVARDNICTSGPVLVDESTGWLNERNVGT
ncbi:DUF6519 domain-containing protein [Nocardia amamiensis]|uniref:DUF6519 domain-containing protein n=1 Tax=Nocardia amamiensis TaxID=404578 RepID=UPI0033D02486